MTSTTAVVLAGGRSSRMGRPKALLPFDNQPLITHVVSTLQRQFSEVVLVSSAGHELPSLPAIVVHDDVAYQGPVGGICYGLRAATGELCFVTSCDVVFLNPQLISHLLAQAPGHDVVVPHWQDRLQPLHAVYRRSVLPLLEAQLARGELRPVYLFDKVRTRRVEEEEIRRFDPEGWSFFNMNSPEDYARALQHWDEINGSIQCTVELFGVARMIARTKDVSLQLPSGATIAQVLAALAEKLPMLVGRVINADAGSLVDGYACNVNGRDFVRSPATTVNAGDSIVILSADAGG